MVTLKTSVHYCNLVPLASHSAWCFRLYLFQVRSARHVNLNPFIGASIDSGTMCVVNQYCSKGSLQDVIENDNIKLDKIFKLSFAVDITQVR